MKRFLTPLLASLVLLVSCARPNAQPPTQNPPEAPNAPAPTAAAEVVHVDHTALISSLIDPAKLDTLKGDRAANTRLRKVTYWLEVSRRQGDAPAELIGNAQAHAGYGGTARARADKESLLRNLTILERLGCLTDDGMAKLRTGRAPTITRGPYAGDIAEVDHILPRSRFPQLDEKLFNLEFMPATLNRRKSDTMGQRQRALEAEWRATGLLDP